MKLSTRLLLLILGCLVPILAAQFYTLARQHADRRARQGDTVLWQAELAMNDLSGVIEGVRRLSRIAARLPNIRQPEDANCTAELGTLQHDLPSLSFVAIVDGAGRLLCGSHPILAAAWNTPPAWLPDLKDGDGIGRIGTVAGLVHPFLPIATASPAVGDNRAIIAALDLDWLSTHLAELRPHRPDVPIRPLLFIVDPDGTIVGMDANAGPTVGIGTRLPEILRPLVAKTSADQLMIEAPQGLGWLSATVPAPAAAAAAGLRAITTIGVPSPLTSFAAFVVWDVLLTGGCALMALILTWQAGHRFIYQPTEMLLLTAQRWRDGDLNVRAGMTGRGSEFDSLAQSFNAMASSLQARDQERRLQAELLESLVAERTRALSEINNRLQVEVAEREKTEAALHQAQKLQAVGQLAGGVAHDFNNMLATVLGNLELMQHRVAQVSQVVPKADTDRLDALIARATGAVQRGAHLTSRLLAFSRRQRLATRPTDLNRLVAELVSLATSTLGRRVRVVTDLAPDLWPAMVDPSQVEAALLNLCLNARDAMPDGGQLTITTMNLAFEGGRADDPPPGAYVRVAIGDTGLGMTPEVRRQAFDPFFTTKGPGGSGLGLSQVYGMARQSGGTVVLDSAEGKGTEVALLLPRAMSDEETDVASSPDDNQPLEMNKLLVMVVDDDQAVRQVAVEMLRDLGCGVVQAQGGAEALALIDTLPRGPDIVLMDYAMPGMNGMRVAAELRLRGIDAAIALVTGYAEVDDGDAAGNPLDGLLRKPFSILDLRKLLASLRKRTDARTEEPASMN
jgi:signal transduction histidine kinase/CheY-like chemotaxis protein